jgi:probable HAF family extracellular repeat protein
MRRRSSPSPLFLLSALFSTVLSFFLGGPSQLTAGPIYSVVDLGALGTGSAMPAALNGSGMAVGFVTDVSGNQVPVAFSGQASPLGGVGQASGVNDTGTVVGTQMTGGNPIVTEWSNGQATSLNVSGYGTGINNAGQVVGGYLTPNGQLHAFTSSNGKMVDLGTLAGGTWSSSYAVNAAGEIVGTSAIGNGLFRAFFSNGTGMTSLGTFAGTNGSSYALGLNSYGEIVGNAQTAQGFAHAFLWNGAALIDLGTLGGSQSYAYGVNDAGTVVGYSLTSDNSTHAFVYADGVMLDLNHLLPVGSEWTIEDAYAINAAGDILGTGVFDGQSYAVELLPSGVDAEVLGGTDVLSTPEPAAGRMCVAGVVLMAAGMLLRSRACRGCWCLPRSRS